MTNSNPRIAKMNQTLRHGASALMIFLITGCSHWDLFGAGNTYVEDTPTAVSSSATQMPASAAPVMTVETQTEALIVPPEQNNDSDFINYRQSAADYREFGERAPRDQDIVTSGAGSNMAASIPPTIEEEVTDYEEEINAAIEENSDSSQSQQSVGEDPVEDWLAEEGSTLKGLLTDWSERAGWRLIWNSNRNYTLAAGAMFRGRFADVSSALIRTFARAKPAPVATFYKGNRVLVVETMEDENAYN